MQLKHCPFCADVSELIVQKLQKVSIISISLKIQTGNPPKLHVYLFNQGFNQTLPTCTGAFDWKIIGFLPWTRILMVRISQKLYYQLFISLFKLNFPATAAESIYQTLIQKLSICGKLFDWQTLEFVPCIGILLVRIVKKVLLAKLYFHIETYILP